MSKLIIIKILGYISTLALMSLTAKVLTISDFAYLNLFLQWLVPLTIIQTLGLPLVSNIYVGGGEMSVNQYLLISKKILQKILIISIPVFIVTAVNLFGISLDLIVPYLILLLANIVLYFQSQLLQARKLFFESFLVSNYGQRGVLLSTLSCLMIGIFYFLEIQFNISNILLIIFFSILITIFYAHNILQKSYSPSYENISITEKQLANEGLKISLNSIFHNLTFPLIFLIGISYLSENTVAKYQTNLKLIFLMLHFYQGILMNVLIPDIYRLFSENKKLLLSRIKKIMFSTFMLGSLIILLFYLYHKPFIVIMFSEKFLIENNELINLSLILLTGIIFDCGFSLLTYCKFNREALLIRLLGFILGALVASYTYFNLNFNFSINLLLVIFYVLPNTFAFLFWLKIVKKSFIPMA